MAPNEANAIVIIKVERLQQTLSLAEYVQESIKEINKFFTKVKILEQKDSTLANSPAYELTFQGLEDGVSVKKTEVGIVRTDKAYVVIYGAEIGQYEKFEPTVREMIRSFELLSE